MRNKIILVNAVIVVIVGLLSYAIVHGALKSSAGDPALLTERVMKRPLPDPLEFSPE